MIKKDVLYNIFLQIYDQHRAAGCDGTMVVHTRSCTDPEHSCCSLKICFRGRKTSRVSRRKVMVNWAGNIFTQVSQNFSFLLQPGTPLQTLSLNPVYAEKQSSVLVKRAPHRDLSASSHSAAGGAGQPGELLLSPASNQPPSAGCGAGECLISCTHTPSIHTRFHTAALVPLCLNGGQLMAALQDRGAAFSTAWDLHIMLCLLGFHQHCSSLSLFVEFGLQRALPTADQPSHPSMMGILTLRIQSVSDSLKLV